MSEAKGLIFDINENEIMSHIEDGTLSQFLKSWRNTQLIKLAKEPQECEWKLFDEDMNAYDTSCGESFYLTDGTPNENKMQYCPYCGRKIKESKDD